MILKMIYTKGMVRRNVFNILFSIIIIITFNQSYLFTPVLTFVNMSGQIELSPPYQFASLSICNPMRHTYTIVRRIYIKQLLGGTFVFSYFPTYKIYVYLFYVMFKLNDFM